MRVGVCVVTLALAAAASGAIEPPSTLGSARLGSLTVTSSALVSQKTVELMGVWNDPKAPCSANRKLRVRAAVDYIPAGGRPAAWPEAASSRAPTAPKAGRTSASRSPRASSASPALMGRGSPLYNFLTQTTEPKRGLKATASLNWLNPKRRC
jgi:hypothetical protein